MKRRYGICYEDGSIRIRLRNLRTGGFLKYSALVDTLCHELAHLRHFDHGPRFKAFYLRILERARREGIYRPDPRPAQQPDLTRIPLSAPRIVPSRAAGARAVDAREPKGPVQLPLF